MVTDKRLLSVWRAMHNRCYNPKQKSFADYGGRGIRVSPCWHGREGFERFIRDMGECPVGGTIERKDVEADYGPDNCCWATRHEQARNKRNNHLITAQGRTLALADWALELGCSHAAILGRMRRGMPAEQAVTAPVPKRPNSRLKEEDALYIREKYPTMTASAIAAELGVCKKTILNVIHGKTFADIKEAV